MAPTGPIRRPGISVGLAVPVLAATSATSDRVDQPGVNVFRNAFTGTPLRRDNTPTDIADPPPAAAATLPSPHEPDQTQWLDRSRGRQHTGRHRPWLSTRLG